MPDFNILAKIQRATYESLGVSKLLRLTNVGSLTIAQYELPYAALATAGRLFAGETGAGTAIAPVAAWPTTVGTWMLWNGEPAASRKHQFVETVAFTLISGTSGAGGAILGASGQLAMAAPTAYASSRISSLSGLTGPPTAARIAQGVTITGAQPAWAILSTSEAAAAATAGANSVVANVGGKIRIAPQFAAFFTLFSGVGTTALYAFSATWAEVEVDVET